MRAKTTLSLLLLLSLWASPLRAAEPTRMTPLLPIGGVVLEVPLPEKYESLPESDRQFAAIAERMRAIGPLRTLGVFRAMGPIQGKIMVVGGQETTLATTIGFDAMRGLFRNIDWGIEARKQVEGQAGSHVDPTQTGLFAESELHAAAALVAQPNKAGDLPFAVVMLVQVYEGKFLFFYFYEPITSKDTQPELKTEALRYFEVCKDTGKLRFAEADGR